MGDISKLSSKAISELAGVYLYTKFTFDVEPLEAPKSVQRIIRKRIAKTCTQYVRELPELDAVFSAQNSDEEVLQTLKACFDLEQSHAEETEAKIERDLAALDTDAKAAVKELLELEFWPKIEFVGSDIQITLEDSTAFRRTLILKDVDAVPRDKEGYYCENLGLVLKKEENRFCFYGELEDPEEDAAMLFALTFADAAVEIALYNACSGTSFSEKPWQTLQELCFCIARKENLPDCCYNEKEKALLPLIREIATLQAWWMTTSEDEYLSFAQLKKLLQQYGYDRAQKLLRKLEKTKVGDNFTTNRLIAVLCEKQYQPLWRDIYSQLADSQAQYPDKAEIFCDRSQLAGIRKEIQTLLNARGYHGTYPDFVKESPMKGIHLEHAYNLTYWVGMEKRVRYHIRCIESLEDEGFLTIQFLCGTALLKKDEEETDIYDCMFDGKGKRLFRMVHHCIPLQETEDAQADDLETSVTIAWKKAECVKLNKVERKVFYGKMIPGWGLFWWTFMVFGGFFGIFMTLAMMLLCAITTAAFGLFSSIPEMLREIPWGLFLVMGWIGAGGAMGVVEVLAHRK